MSPLSILVVDDAQSFANLLALGMRERGHAVACAPDAKTAVDLLGRLRFDVVLTDIIMPETSGFELIDEVKRLQPKARIVAMSGGGRAYSANACLQAAEGSGIDAVMQKPFGPKELAETLERITGAPERKG